MNKQSRREHYASTYQ